MRIPVKQATDRQIIEYMLNTPSLCLGRDFIESYQDYKLERSIDNQRWPDDILFDVTLFGANYYENDGLDAYINDIYINEIKDWDGVFFLPKNGYIDIYDNEESEHPLF